MVREGCANNGCNIELRASFGVKGHLDESDIAELDYGPEDSWYNFLLGVEIDGFSVEGVKKKWNSEVGIVE